MTATTIVNGLPRYHHKTTKLVHDAWERNRGTNETIIHIANNYEQADELAIKAYGSGKYGVNAPTVVIPKGQERASKFCRPNCNHNVGDEYFRHQHVAERAVDSNQIVRPRSFQEHDICAYAATRYAVEFADAVILHPSMISRIELPDNYQIIVDEESAQNYFRVPSAEIAQITSQESDFIAADTINIETSITKESIEAIRDHERDAIDDLERVPMRYQNIERACDALIDMYDRIAEIEPRDIDDFIEQINETEPARVEIEGSEAEQKATYERIRMEYAFFSGAELIEAAFFEPELRAIPSTGSYKIKYIGHPDTGYLYRKDFFENAGKVWLVGKLLAADFAERFTNDIEYEELTGDVEDLSVFIIDEEDEFARRVYIERLAKRLNSGHAIFAGSAERAKQVRDNLEPDAYFMSQGATRTHFEDAVENDWSVISYPNSKISRGVDLPVNVSMVRSRRFSAGIWDYASGDTETSRKCRRISEYMNTVETLNMMLRGAGQGEPHVAVIPPTDPMFEQLDSHIETLPNDLDLAIQTIGREIAESHPEYDMFPITDERYSVSHQL